MTPFVARKKHAKILATNCTRRGAVYGVRQSLVNRRLGHQSLVRRDKRRLRVCQCRYRRISRDSHHRVVRRQKRLPRGAERRRLANDGRTEVVPPVCCIKFVEKLLCNASDSRDLLVRLSKSMQHSTLHHSFKARKAHLWTLQTFHKRELT